MILVSLNKSWPQVLAGSRTAADVTLGAWAKVSDAAIEEYGDVIAGIYKNEVVTAYDIDGYTRGGDGDRVTFTGQESTRWAHLVGTPNPGRPWTRGMARPVQYLPTKALEHGDTTVEDTVEGRRAVVDGVTLTVDETGTATVLLPIGRQLIVRTIASSD